MRWQWLVALVAIATETKVHAVFGPRKSQATDRQDTAHRVLRFRRSEYTTDEQEERGPSIPAVETLTNALKATDDIDDWISKGVSTDNVFKLLTLDKASDNLLANPKLTTWIDYMKRFNKENPEQKTSLIATLSAYYGDVGLAKIIEAAKQVEGTAVIAKRLQNEQVYRWLIARKSPKDVFTLLNLDKAGPDLFKQPQVVTWAEYMDKLKKNNPSSRTTLFSFLKPRYEDEAELVTMLLAAEKVSTTKSIAERIQAEQTKLWLLKGKEPGDVFDLLKLDEVGPSLLSDPFFHAWVKYTDDYRKIHYGNRLTTISVLDELFPDDVLSKMILRAGQSPETSGMAKRLLTEQVREWKLQLYDPEDVFELLKLDMGAGALFDNPLFNVWNSFVLYYSKFKPKGEVTVLTELGRYYDERELVEMIVAAHNVPRTKALATNLMKGQLDRWLASKTDPGEVFSILKVDGAAGAANDLRRRIYHNYRDVFSHLPGIHKRKRTEILNTPNKKPRLEIRR